MTTNEECVEARSEAAELLADGDPQGAFSALRPLLEYPGNIDDWAVTWNAFADIADELSGDPLAECAREAANAENDPEALFNLGYELVEVGLQSVGATPLKRAHTLTTSMEIMMELVHCLEVGGFHADAIQTIVDAEDVDDVFICQYLLAFNALMLGDIELARATFESFPTPSPEEEVMADRIRCFLARIDALRDSNTLNGTDLRGWNFVLTGAVLLHLSPFGLEDPMHGRYAFVQDSEGVCRDGVQRLSAVLNSWDQTPERVFFLPERGSEILGLALSEYLGVELVPWPMEGSDQPGLIAVYDLDELPPEWLEGLYESHVDQVLWSHALCWTEQPAFAPDVVTFLYQHNVAPWGERLSYGDSDDVQKTPPDTAPAAEWAKKILSADVSSESVQDLDELLELSAAIGQMSSVDGPNALCNLGGRPPYWTASPVPSARFA